MNKRQSQLRWSLLRWSLLRWSLLRWSLLRWSLLRWPASRPAAAVLAVGLLPAVAPAAWAPAPRALTKAAAVQAPGRIPAASTGPVVVTVPDGSATADRHVQISGRLPGPQPRVVVLRPARDRSRSRYRLAISTVTRAGRPGTGCVYVIHPARVGTSIPEVCGTGSVRLPAGDYVLLAHIVTPGTHGASTTVAIVPLRLTGNRRIVIDARKAVPFQVTLDRAHMRNDQLTEATTFPVHQPSLGPGLVPFFDEVQAGGPGAIHRAYMLPARYSGLRFGYSANWVPGSRAGAAPPCILSGTYRGQIPAVLRYRARVRDLAEITTTGIAADATSSAQLADSVLILHWRGLYAYGGMARRMGLPGVAHIDLTPGNADGQGMNVTGPEGTQTDVLSANGIVPARGRHYRVRFNGAVLGPAGLGLGVYRNGNQIRVVDFGPFTDGAGHEGFDPTATGRMTLASGGKVIATAPPSGVLSASVPPAAARYTLTETLARKDTQLSTLVQTVRTFRSGQVSQNTQLPVLAAVRYAPAGLDARNTAARGSHTHIQVSVVRQPTSRWVPVKTLTLAASFDGGKTWHRLRVTPAKGRGRWTTVVANPPAAGFVSLHADATDANGATLDQIVVNAYAVR